MNSGRNRNARAAYIAGAGRSGSTMIDMLLGTSRKVFSAGEFH